VRLKYAEVPADRVEVIDSWREALHEAVALTPPDQTLFVLPTYTAMLELRAVLTKEGVLQPYWSR
jgi:UDP-N-acetylmuramyl tripeptide synthase